MASRGAAEESREAAPGTITIRDYLFILLLTALLWAVHAIWLTHDTLPPVWDMAMHQSYALNYLPGATVSPMVRFWDLSGNYPPFVHVVIALCFFCFHAGPHVAVLANLPATLLLLRGVFQLGSILAGAAAARWACVLTVLTPYLFWMSRETVLDYWLSAWVVTALAFLMRSNGFESRSASILFGLSSAMGLLTKWLFGGFLAAPMIYAIIRHRVWKSQERLIHCADAVLLAAGISGIWYLPNIPKLVRYFSDNAHIGAREGEPPVFSVQSWIYYLRLLEGYQLFGLLFALLFVSAIFVWRKKLFANAGYWLTLMAGGWVAMTLLRTKDPRFTMPLLGPLMVLTGAWFFSFGQGLKARLVRWGVVALLCVQAYAINFGIPWLPQEIVILRGYKGSLRWDWNLYLQNYFGILGAPRHEDWKQNTILDRVAADSAGGNARPSLGLVPDLARFSAANFQLFSKLRRLPIRVDHIQSVPNGIRAFDGFDYVIMTERDQGMTWSTATAAALNQIIMDEHEVFRLVEIYALPNGDAARLYRIQRGEREGG